MWGADPLGPISAKIGKVVGVHDVISHSKFGFNIFRGYRSTGGQNFRFPIDFAGHRYNSAAATAHPVICNFVIRLIVCRVVNAWYYPLLLQHVELTATHATSKERTIATKANVNQDTFTTPQTKCANVSRLH